MTEKNTEIQANAEDAERPDDLLVNLTLSLALLEKLNKVLWDHQDKGPFHRGWASTKLEKLRSLTDKALEDAVADKPENIK